MWQPTPVFLPGESHGQRSLVGYSPGGHKELDTAEAAEHTCMWEYDVAAKTKGQEPPVSLPHPQGQRT